MIDPSFKSYQCLLRGMWHSSAQGGHILAKMKFPVFSLNFPCVTKIFPVLFLHKKLTISSINKGQITTVLLHTQAYKLIF